ncbi:MAG TPA: response regulator [Candidatus Pacearchaeota archaeon]|nr:response regulator [Candidatus Pacearchaeota archaeon]HOK94390.1 response regulator [Candidatus Pacearchaeota archaeon]HPO75271.1 response regulator [Candidatus Pacearchaeota archaeon]
MKTPKKKILLIEDDPFISDIYITTLNDAGYEVSLANDGLTGLEMAKTIKPDLILLDLLLPGMDGLKVLENIRKEKNEKLNKIPVIIITNWVEKENIEKAKKLGVSGFILKVSLGPKDLIKEVKKYL